MIKVSFKFLSALSYIIVPLIIICVIINFAFCLNPIDIGVSFGETSLLGLPILTILYSAQNTFLASFVTIQSGKNLTQKQQTLISLLTSFILCLLLAIGILCFLICPQIAESDMPFAELSLRVGPYFSLLFGFIIFFSIITTYATTLTSLKEYFNSKKKHNHLLMIAMIVLLSLFDFGTIVEYMYPIIGVFGVIYCLKIYKSPCLNKKLSQF